MANVPANEKLGGSNLGTLGKIVKEQGITALWRGNNANIYRNMGLIAVRVTLFDKIKNMYMPNDVSRYSGLDYYWRYYASAAMCLGVTAALTYPFDLIHTRMASDMSKKGQSRLFITTFDCFNRTNIDEGRKGLYKGVEVSFAASMLRCLITLPLHDILKSQNIEKIDGGNPVVNNFL